jgi:hypothetical protein
MIVRNKKTFGMGAVFAVSFMTVLLFIFSPVFGGKNGLRFADDSFNRLSKGSSYFIPKVSKSNEQFIGRTISVTIKAGKPDDKAGAAEARAAGYAKIFSAAGADAAVTGSSVKIDGDLGKVLASVLQDSDSMFNGRGEEVRVKYAADSEKQVLAQWHESLSKVHKQLQKQKKIDESKIVSDVIKKAVEPAYNFYGIQGEKVVDHAGMMSGLLVFYVAYTMWWGYAIFYMFDGLGLSMKKAKVKKEA